MIKFISDFIKKLLLECVHFDNSYYLYNLILKSVIMYKFYT